MNESAMQFTIPHDQLEKILTARHHDLLQVSGAHAVVADTVPVISVRTFLPFTEQTWEIVGAGCPA